MLITRLSYYSTHDLRVTKITLPQNVEMKTYFNSILFDWAYTIADLGVEDDRPAFRELLKFLKKKNVFDGAFDSLYPSYRELFYDMIAISRESHREACFELVLKYLFIRHDIRLEGRTSLDEILTVYYQTLYGPRKVYADVIPTLELLKSSGIRMGIISNTTNPGFMKDWERKAAGLDSYFEFSIYSSEVPYRKPHPSIFRLALHRLDLPAKQVLYVGDNPKADVIGAQSAGIQVAWLNRKNVSLDKGIQPEYTIFSLSELLDLVSLDNSHGTPT